LLAYINVEGIVKPGLILDANKTHLSWGIHIDNAHLFVTHDGSPTKALIHNAVIFGKAINLNPSEIKKLIRQVIDAVPDLFSHRPYIFGK